MTRTLLFIPILLLTVFGASGMAQNTIASASTDLLGPEDQITIRISNAEDTADQSVRISTLGFITLPLIGQVRAAGLTVEQLQSEVEKRLKKYYKAPEVSVTRMEMRSQPVSVIGAVASPGVHQLQGRKTLIEMLSLAGGAREDAGSTIRITRRLEWGRIPLTNAADDPTGQFSIAEVPLKDLIQATNPAVNILIMPDDTISVPKAEVLMIYVIGEVIKSGGIVVGGHEQVTVLQALSMAGGMSKAANAAQGRILRPNPTSLKRDEIPVDLKALLMGKIRDVAMQANDILVVPNKGGSVFGAVEAALRVGTSIAIIGVRP